MHRHTCYSLNVLGLNRYCCCFRLFADVFLKPMNAYYSLSLVSHYHEIPALSIWTWTITCAIISLIVANKIYFLITLKSLPFRHRAAHEYINLSMNANQISYISVIFFPSHDNEITIVIAGANLLVNEFVSIIFSVHLHFYRQVNLFILFVYSMSVRFFSLLSIVSTGWEWDWHHINGHGNSWQNKKARYGIA